MFRGFDRPALPHGGDSAFTIAAADGRGLPVEGRAQAMDWGGAAATGLLLRKADRAGAHDVHADADEAADGSAGDLAEMLALAVNSEPSSSTRSAASRRSIRLPKNSPAMPRRTLRARAFSCSWRRRASRRRPPGSRPSATPPTGRAPRPRFRWSGAAGQRGAGPCADPCARRPPRRAAFLRALPRHAARTRNGAQARRGARRGHRRQRGQDRAPRQGQPRDPHAAQRHPRFCRGDHGRAVRTGRQRRYQRLSKDIHNSGKHVISLVNDLLDLSQDRIRQDRT